MTATTTFRCRNGTVVEVGDRWACTTLPSGAVVYAYPRYDDAQAATARELGYGRDVEAMTRDHDPMHAIVSDLVGLPASIALRVAAGEEVDERLAQLEETAVIALQRYARAVGVDALDMAAVYGVRMSDDPTPDSPLVKLWHVIAFLIALPIIWYMFRDFRP